MLTHLTLDGERIDTTPEHPFYTEEQGWVNAGDLCGRAHIRQADGTPGVASSAITTEQRSQVMRTT